MPFDFGAKWSLNLGLWRKRTKEIVYIVVNFRFVSMALRGGSIFPLFYFCCFYTRVFVTLRLLSGGGSFPVSGKLREAVN
jgi:hypothetical protein